MAGDQHDALHAALRNRRDVRWSEEAPLGQTAFEHELLGKLLYPWVDDAPARRDEAHEVIERTVAGPRREDQHRTHLRVARDGILDSCPHHVPGRIARQRLSLSRKTDPPPIARLPSTRPPVTLRRSLPESPARRTPRRSPRRSDSKTDPPNLGESRSAWFYYTLRPWRQVNLRVTNTSWLYGTGQGPMVPAAPDLPRYVGFRSLAIVVE